jgi:hypothetical protein
MYIPDITEQWENAAESWAFDNIKYNTETKKEMFHCGCGKWEDLDKGEVVSANPWATPVCGKCFQEMLEKEEKE